MERLTSPNINVDPDTDRFLHAAIGGKEIDWKQSRDSTLNVLINGPTSNGFGKDIFRKMVRDLYGRLKAYEDTGLEPEEVLPKDKADEIALKLMRLADLESVCSYTRLRELAEADKDGRVVVLPCKVGEKLWVIGRDNVPREMELEAPDIRTVCTDEDSFCMSTCNRKPDGYCAYRLRNDGTSIGKTVFLTHEEAEKALREMEGKKDV
jgi:hypothetical protein|nr:MAG TPA: hypothetical protein [Caudoviricetes sp.]